VRLAAVVAETGRAISPLCRAYAVRLAAALQGQGVEATVLVHDNTLAGHLPAQQAASLAACELLALIGHGDGVGAAGIGAGNLPPELSGQPVVVNGACSGGEVAEHATLARELFARGALLQAAGGGIHGWAHVAPFLEHAWRSGGSAGEAWARTLVELRRGSGSGGAGDPGGWLLEVVAGVPADWSRDVLERSILIGDPALVPFPRAGSDLRPTLLEAR
jgi:hypothetical protein